MEYLGSPVWKGLNLLVATGGNVKVNDGTSTTYVLEMCKF